MAAEPCAKFNREKIVFVLAVTYPAKIIGREGIRAANAAFGQNGQTCWVRYRAWLFARRIARIRIGRSHPAVGRIENISAAIMHTAERIDIDIFIDVCKLFIN